METFQRLKVFLSKDKMDSFFIELVNEINKSKWLIRNDLVENYRKNTFTSEKKVLCIESEKYILDKKPIKGLLWMWDFSGYFEVFNIVPVESRLLEFKEYNYILNEFYSRFVVNLSNKYAAKIEITSPIKRIVDTIGEDALKALKAFSNGANKVTGHSNPYDFERWCEFVFIIFRQEKNLNVDELIVWFEENGWSNEMAHKLGLDFEYSIDLLERYEQH